MSTKPQIYVDLDGVEADLHGACEKIVGFRPSPKRLLSSADWSKIARIPGFWATLPLMPGALQLWNGVVALAADFDLAPPVILTGVRSGIPSCAADKVDWVRHHLSRTCQIITCNPSLKSGYCDRGDIIVDDWPVHRQKWIDKGGHWILHNSAEQSLKELATLLKTAWWNA